MLIGVSNHNCDNKYCRKVIEPNETIFSCFKCNFDLCSFCIQLTVDNEVPLDEDDEQIVDNTLNSSLVQFFKIKF
jgi:hypothetical protein